MRYPFVAVAILLGLVGSAQAQLGGPVFATPMPPGPGTVTLPTNAGRMLAPVLMPLSAPTAAPVGAYYYPGPTLALTGAQSPTESAPTNAGQRFWLEKEILLAFGQGSSVPALATLAPAGTAAGRAGALYQPTTTIAFGDGRLGDRGRIGSRVHGGLWFDSTQTHGLDASFLYLDRQSDNFAGSSAPGGVVLARPLVDGATQTNIGAVVGGPVPGGMTASVRNFAVGFDLNYRHALGIFETSRTDLLIGYRYFHLGDRVELWQSGVAKLAMPNGPGSAVVNDSFHTRNNFHGPQVGVAEQIRLGSGFTFDVSLKLALGATVSSVNTTATATSNGATYPVGVLVGGTNQVADRTAYFAVLPEVGMKLGYQFSEHFRVTAGYGSLYLSTVRRAAEQIDLTVNAPGRPGFRNATSDYWLQTLSLGIEARY